MEALLFPFAASILGWSCSTWFIRSIPPSSCSCPCWPESKDTICVELCFSFSFLFFAARSALLDGLGTRTLSCVGVTGTLQGWLVARAKAFPTTL